VAVAAGAVAAAAKAAPAKEMGIVVAAMGPEESRLRHHHQDAS